MCENDCGPWTLWSHCGFVALDPNTEVLVEVACPSRHCATWVRLADSKLIEHERTEGGRRPWTGVRVDDDRAAFHGMPVIDPEAARWSGEQ
ncbi:hypothetical protein OHA40_10700 [Nocardia sp. NBC_00508]|uniref:hypothetical protein n=1 Tax=Nocardia sp. NBC_00508 TaxID=2975992 RepID=UPI002E81140E|nr:hypothetical protein [Nocardia sp. NBC_00508]WUD68529.1 hypothetical protein OHA40_10700 [Nocardia sp. NBC_00508]